MNIKNFIIILSVFIFGVLILCIFGEHILINNLYDYSQVSKNINDMNCYDYYAITNIGNDLRSLFSNANNSNTFSCNIFYTKSYVLRNLAIYVNIIYIIILVLIKF